jgi:hypothetical protein
VVTVVSVTLLEKVAAAARKVRFFVGVRRIAAQRKETFRAKVREATEDIERHERWLKEHPGQLTARARYHVGRLRAAHVRRERLHGKLAFWRQRYVWARNRDEFWEELLAARRRKLSARKVDAADFENGMTGSHEFHTLTRSAKAVVAIGVLKFGLWVSSTYRPETPGSHHAEDPTRGGDLAGEWGDMIRFQRWLYENHLGALLELYGPDNRLCADNGVPAPQAEGTFNENLHDSHDHAFIADPGYPLAFGRAA